MAKHFGGGAFDKDKPPSSEADDKAGKTKKEIMQDLIQKSKYFKMERQQEAADQQSLVEDLDSSFAHIREMMDFKDTVRDAKNCVFVMSPS